MSINCLNLPRIGPDKTVRISSVRNATGARETDDALDQAFTDLLMDGFTIELVQYIPEDRLYRVFATRPDDHKEPPSE